MIACSVSDSGNQRFTKKTEFRVSDLPTVMRKVWNLASKSE